MNEKPPEPPAFEAALARLEAIVRRLEEGEIALDEAIAGFEEGLGLLKSCRSTLQRAELRVRELLQTPDAPGEAPRNR